MSLHIVQPLLPALFRSDVKCLCVRMCVCVGGRGGQIKFVSILYIAESCERLPTLSTFGLYRVKVYSKL